MEPRGLPDLHLRSWSTQETAPADVWALAQASDGYLWLGTGFGLYRFDGVEFEPVLSGPGQQYASTNITALTILPDNTVWIGYFSGVSTLKDGVIRHYRSPRDGIPTGAVYRIAQDRRGTIWVASGGGLLYFDNGVPRVADAGMGYPWHQAEWVLCDARGTIWVANGESIAFRPAGESRFRSSGIAAGRYAVLAEAADGTVWLSDALRGTRPIAAYAQDGSVHIGERKIPALATLVAKRMLVRGDGSLWGTDALHGGVFRATPVGGTGGYQTEHLGRGQGLPSDMAVPVLEDREGNLWAGTNMGLSRFRRRNVFMLPEVGGINYGAYGLFSLEGGEVAIVTPHEQMRADRDLLRLAVSGRSPATRDITAARWLIDVHGVWSLHAGRRTALPPPAGVDWLALSAGAIDAGGTPWASFHDAGTQWWDGRRWIRDQRLPPNAALAIAAGSDGSLWLGYADNEVRVLKDGKLRRYGAGDGLQVGNVTAIHATGSDVVVAGELGVAILAEQGFRTIAGSRISVLLGVTGIVPSEDGDLWLNGNRGIVRISPASLLRAALDPSHAPEYRVFDAFDGLAGIALQAVPVPTAARGADGLLWFATNQGIAVIDPLDIVTNPRSPDVVVRELASGDATHRAGAPIDLPSRTGNVQIAYTATSLTIPERVRFRYRLDGVDDDWREVGTRRQAFYTNLGPGKYRFNVMAANNDGVWSAQGAALDFSIRPTFFQTPWFVLVCTLFVALVLYAAYLLHMREIAARLRARLEERHLERERIARELHDTLLQGFQGLILRIHVLVGQLREADPLKRAMERAVDQAEAALVEGRDSVRGLRVLAHRDLADALAAIGAEFATQSKARLRVSVEGTLRALQPLARDELYRIGREAIVNALRHAAPGQIDVTLAFGEEGFRLLVSDDGTGIDAAVMKAGIRPGHFGLPGMRERIGRIGGMIDIRPGSVSGTEVLVTLPRKAAYLRKKRA